MAIVHVIGASGRSGAALCAALQAGGDTAVPVVRNAARWAAAGFPWPPRIADLEDKVALASALQDAAQVVSCSHARHAPSVLAAAPPDAAFVLLGSTRKFSQWRDAHGAGVLAGEAAFLASHRNGVMLHPTMIYGAQGEDNVRRLAALLRRLPVMPLPQGGRALVQPIHQDDVTACVLAALRRRWDGPQVLTVAGPAAVRYADFVGAVAVAAGLAPPRVLPVPAWVLMAACGLTRLPGVPRVRAAEIRRLLESKAFDIGPMRAMLGVEPRSLAAGLATTLTH